MERRFLTPAFLRDWVTSHALPAYRAEQILRWVYRRGAKSFAVMTDVPLDLRQDLEADFLLPPAPSPTVLHGADGTRKLLLRFEDDRAVETVIIPDAPRLTLCLSTQVGCGMGCRFCATGQMGLRRNLDVNEIVAQVAEAIGTLRSGERLTNLVFMGMGEPLHNYEATVGAIEILMADWGWGFSGRRITVSTVGLLPQLERLVRETAVQVAVSLNATTDELRERLMPVNRRYPIRRLIEVCRRLPVRQRRRITFEYVLLDGINDGVEDARRMARLLRGIRAKVNLIPCNPFPGSAFRAPPPDVVRRFQECLLEQGIGATVRTSRGGDICAACGQLAAAAV